MGGKEHASSRYIYTNLAPMTRTVFNESDEAVLKWQEEEGHSIEPESYMPIVPMVLINGAEGIGTGWSTYIPCFNPLDIISNIQKKLVDKDYQFKKMCPWYKNFVGQIVENEENYTIRGQWQIKDNYTLEITELPVRKWTSDYKAFIEEMMIKDYLIEDMQEFHKENTVSFILNLKEKISSIENLE